MSDAADTPPAPRSQGGEAKDSTQEPKSTKVTATTRATTGGRYVARLLKARSAGRATLGALLLMATAWATALPASAQPPINLLPIVNDSEVCLQNIRGQERQHDAAKQYGDCDTQAHTHTNSSQRIRISTWSREVVPFYGAQCRNTSQLRLAKRRRTIEFRLVGKRPIRQEHAYFQPGWERRNEWRGIYEMDFQSALSHFGP